MEIILPLLLIFGVPIYFVFIVSRDHFAAMDAAMTKYKYRHTITYMLKERRYNNHLGVWENVILPYPKSDFLTEEQYLKRKEYYDSTGELRRVKRSDFKTNSTYLDHGDGRLDVSTMAYHGKVDNNANNLVSPKEPQKSKFVLTRELFDEEMEKIKTRYEDVDSAELIPILEEADLRIKSLSSDRLNFAKESGDWSMYSYLSENQGFITTYAELCALERMLLDRKVDHPIIREYAKDLKEIRKLTRR